MAYWLVRLVWFLHLLHRFVHACTLLPYGGRSPAGYWLFVVTGWLVINAFPRPGLFSSSRGLPATYLLVSFWFLVFRFPSTYLLLHKFYAIFFGLVQSRQGKQFWLICVPMVFFAFYLHLPPTTAHRTLVLLVHLLFLPPSVVLYATTRHIQLYAFYSLTLVWLRIVLFLSSRCAHAHITSHKKRAAAAAGSYILLSPGVEPNFWTTMYMYIWFGFLVDSSWFSSLDRICGALRNRAATWMSSVPQDQDRISSALLLRATAAKRKRCCFCANYRHSAYCLYVSPFKTPLSPFSITQKRIL